MKRRSSCNNFYLRNFTGQEFHEMWKKHVQYAHAEPHRISKTARVIQLVLLLELLCKLHEQLFLLNAGILIFACLFILFLSCLVFALSCIVVSCCSVLHCPSVYLPCLILLPLKCISFATILCVCLSIYSVLVLISQITIPTSFCL